MGRMRGALGVVALRGNNVGESGDKMWRDTSSDFNPCSDPYKQASGILGTLHEYIFPHGVPPCHMCGSWWHAGRPRECQIRRGGP